MSSVIHYLQAYSSPAQAEIVNENEASTNIQLTLLIY